MLRIYFTHADMCRIRLKPLDRLTETWWAIRAFQGEDRPEIFGKWRARVRKRAAALDDPKSFHDVAIGSAWPRVQAYLRAEQARHSLTLATQGIDALLAGLDPAVCWRPPRLTIQHQSDVDIHMRGRGLHITVSLFGGPNPMVETPPDPARPILLVLPVTPDPAAATRLLLPQDQDFQALRALVGTTRARVLEAIADCALGTAELAGKLGISPSGVSQHAAVLRRAGLITTERDDQAVRHVVTALGSSLLAQET